VLVVAGMGCINRDPNALGGHIWLQRKAREADRVPILLNSAMHWFSRRRLQEKGAYSAPKYFCLLDQSSPLQRDHRAV
jgi:hypothetical protein